MSKTVLNPCPFCGGRAFLVYNMENKIYKATCVDCGISIIPEYPELKGMPKFKTKEEVIAVWNRRACDE